MIKEKEVTITNLDNKLRNSSLRLYRMENNFKELDQQLPNSIIALDDKGVEVDYYRIKVVDENDDFDGYRVGDKVPHIRRKVNYKWKNVPVTLKLKRE